MKRPNSVMRKVVLCDFHECLVSLSLFLNLCMCVSMQLLSISQIGGYYNNHVYANNVSEASAEQRPLNYSVVICLTQSMRGNSPAISLYLYTLL